MKLRKGDEVAVLRARTSASAARSRTCSPSATRSSSRAPRASTSPRSTRSPPGHDAGRHHRQGDADPRLERGAGVQQGRPGKVGYRFDDDGKKIRVCRKCGRTSDGRRDRRPRAPAPQGRATTPRSSPRSRPSSGSATSCRCRASRRSWSTWVSAAPRSSVAARRRGHRPHDHHRPEAARYARRRSRSRASSSARATRSAPR